MKIAIHKKTWSKQVSILPYISPAHIKIYFFNYEHVIKNIQYPHSGSDVIKNISDVKKKFWIYKVKINNLLIGR